MLTAGLIDDACAFLKGRIRRTPVEHSPALSAVAGVPVTLKLENLQITGSFKIRGAWFRLSRLTPAERAAGILTCSAGNHGKAVAHAAREEGLAAEVCVPTSIDAAKREGICRLGGVIRMSAYAGYDDTQAWALELAAREGKTSLHAYEDFAVMAGNGGSLAREVCEEVPGARHYLVPVGGGGLAAGFALASGREVIGCQLEASPALAMSLARGEAVTALPAADTLAGGLEGGIGANAFAILKNRVERTALLTEEEIGAAVRWLAAEHQYFMEPSAAVTVAAILTGKCGPLLGPAVAVISGRNAALATLQGLLAC